MYVCMQRDFVDMQHNKVACWHNYFNLNVFNNKIQDGEHGKRPQQLSHYAEGLTSLWIRCNTWMSQNVVLKIYIASTPTTTLYILRIIEVLFSHSHQCDFLQFHRPKITPFLGDFWTLFVRCSEGFYYTDKLISPKNFRDYSCPFQ